VAIVNFALIRLAPGDPATVLAGESGSADQRILTQLREEFGLDLSLPIQLGNYLRNLAKLDLGQSYRQKRPVSAIIAERLPATLLLTASAFVLSLILGMAIGILAAARVGTWSDTLISAGALLIFAMPIYWVGLMAVLLFSVQLGLLPAFGMETLGSGYTGFQRAWDVLAHLLMPMFTLALFYIAMYARLMRASMLEVQFEDYIKTARAKGAGPRRILFRHALRNAVLPVVTVAGVQAGHLLGGAILIETVFAWPGLGRLALEAVTQRDYTVLLGTFVVTSAVGLLFNILTDLLYTAIDPRIELASR
jgi:peptide/nickel transport system permease protein